MKKAISFLLAAFLILMGLAKADVATAQIPKGYTWSHWGTSDMYVPLFLKDGEPVEVQVVTPWHCTCHWEYDSGVGWYNQTWMLMRWQGSFEYDGIIYKLNDQCTYGKHLGKDWNDPAYYSIKFVSNVKGSDGSHLVASGTFIMYDADWNWVGTFEYDKIVSN
jgi:hypothetical protein